MGSLQVVPTGGTIVGEWLEVADVGQHQLRRCALRRGYSVAHRQDGCSSLYGLGGRSLHERAQPLGDGSVAFFGRMLVPERHGGRGVTQAGHHLPHGVAASCCPRRTRAAQIVEVQA